MGENLSAVGDGDLAGRAPGRSGTADGDHTAAAAAIAAATTDALGEDGGGFRERSGDAPGISDRDITGVAGIAT